MRGQAELSAGTVNITIAPIRAVCRRGVARGELLVNPCAGLDLPTPDGRRERFATPTEAEALIASAPNEDRTVWATPLYAGLRRGELMALRWDCVDLAKA